MTPFPLARPPVWQADDNPTHYFVMPLWCPSLEGICFYLLSNHHCSSLITPSLPDAWGRHKKKSKSDSERSLRSGSRREKVFRCQGWEVEGPGSVGGSDEALWAVNEGWTDTLITPCNLRGANRWIFPFDKRDYKQSPGPDNRDLPCNVSTIDSGHKKKGGSDRRSEELEEDEAGEGGVDVTSAKRYHLWDNVKMGRGVVMGRGGGGEVGQGGRQGQHKAWHHMGQLWA